MEMFLSASYTLTSNITTLLSTPESLRAVTWRFFRLKKDKSQQTFRCRWTARWLCAIVVTVGVKRQEAGANRGAH